METLNIKIKALKGVFNKQEYFNAIVNVSLLSKMKEAKLYPESCNMIFIDDDNYIWEEDTSTIEIKDLKKLEYLLFTGDLDIANADEKLPFVICNKEQENTLFYIG